MTDESEFKLLTELTIPFKPTPGQEHTITVRTVVDPDTQLMEAHVKWENGTSIPELLVATAILAGNVGKIMQEVALSLKQSGENYQWCLQNMNVLVGMAKALGQMAGTEDAGGERPGVQH